MARKNDRNQSTAKKTNEAPADGPGPEAGPRELTEQEWARVQKYLQRRKIDPPWVARNEDKRFEKSLVLREDLDPLLPVKLAEAFGTRDTKLQIFLLEQLYKTFPGALTCSPAGEVEFDPDRLMELANVALSILAALEPRDEIETMLICQMVAVNNTAMELTKQAMMAGQNPEYRNRCLAHANRMMGTYLSQMQALRRYRGGVQQKVTVEHVHVGEGGKAIVGNVSAPERSRRGEGADRG